MIPKVSYMSGALSGLKILDLTSVLMGPFATQILADMGADVIKIEPPAGDTVRGIGPMRNPGMGSNFFACQPQQTQSGSSKHPQ